MGRNMVIAIVSMILLSPLFMGCIGQNPTTTPERNESTEVEERPYVSINLTYLDDTSSDFRTWDVDICTPQDYGVLILRYSASDDNITDTVQIGIVSVPDGYRISLEKESVSCKNGTVVPIIITYFTNASAGSEADVVVSAVSSKYPWAWDNITLHLKVSHNGLPVAKKGDKVVVSYVLYDVNGTQLDSGTLPATAGEKYVGPAQQLGYIEGFYLGLLGMYRGETKPIRVPPELAYGTDGSSQLSGQTLIFVLTLDLLLPKG